MSASELVVDAALALTLVELAVLVVTRWRSGRARELPALVANVGAGLCLMVAIRLALAGAAWPWLAACLSGAGVAHLADMAARARIESSSLGRGDEESAP